VIGLLHNNIPASFLGTGQTDEMYRDIYKEIYSGHPELKLIYVTPEMISKSQRFIGALQSLHSKGLFARLIIDEAHCVSQVRLRMSDSIHPKFDELFLWVSGVTTSGLTM